MQPGIIKVFEHDSEMNIDALRRTAKPVVITEAGINDIGDAHTSGWIAHPPPVARPN